MIGFLAINEKGEPCFAQIGQSQRVAAIRLVPGPCCLVCLQDGTEEMFTDEIQEDLVRVMRQSSDIFVGHFDEEGALLDEYAVPLTAMA